MNPKTPPMKGLCLLAGAALTFGAAPSSSAQAQCVGPQCETEFSFADKVLQKAPTHFKFQARISQAKLPVGEAVFDSLRVKLKSGQRVLCSEEFSAVRVQDSVLNLEIGRAMNCGQGVAMADVVAAHSDVNLQVCIGGGENCLKPISVGAVPYAMKSSYAHQAQNASQANTAAQCNYAHRVTADRDLFVTQKLGDGYYDFHTPSRLDNLALDPSSHRDGFIQWTPLDATHNRLHLCGKDPSNDEVRRLSALWIHADTSQLAGQLVVRDRAYAQLGLRAGFGPEQESELGGEEQLVVRGDSRMTGALLVRGDVNAKRDAVVDNDLTVKRDGNVEGDLRVTGNGFASKLFAGSGSWDPSTVNDTLSVFGDSNVQGHSTVSRDARVGGSALIGPWDVGATVNPPATLAVHGDSLTQGRVFVGDWEPAAMDSAEARLSVNGDISALQSVNVGDGLTVTGLSDLHNVEVTGTVTTTGRVTAPNITVSQDLGVTGTTTTASLKTEQTAYFLQDVHVTGTLHGASANLSGSLKADGTLTSDDLKVRDQADVEKLRVNSSLDAEGPVIFEGPVTFKGEVNLEGDTPPDLGYKIVTSPVAEANGGPTTAVADCGAGYRALGGGYAYRAKTITLPPDCPLDRSMCPPPECPFDEFCPQYLSRQKDAAASPGDATAEPALDPTDLGSWHMMTNGPSPDGRRWVVTIDGSYRFVARATCLKLP